MGILSQHARQDRNAVLLQNMREAKNRQSHNAWVRQHNLRVVTGRRIALLRCLDILLQDSLQHRKALRHSIRGFCDPLRELILPLLQIFAVYGTMDLRDQTRVEST